MQEWTYEHANPPGFLLVEWNITGSDSEADPYYEGITTGNVGNIYGFGMQDDVEPGGYRLYEMAVAFNYTGYDTTGVVSVTGDLGAALSPSQDAVYFVVDIDNYNIGSRATTGFVVAYGKNNLEDAWTYAGSGFEASGYRYMRADVTLSGNGNDSPTFRNVTMYTAAQSGSIINIPTFVADNVLYTFSDGNQYVAEGVTTIDLSDPLVVYVKEEQ
jgi:hypothetical protein